ncbi:MAG: 50S ribosomal protein L11 methyltransferase [Chloroflexi bacterium]|nr:50S ribosomal protein L11 methyltransferase [Chloroflexota bacterium]
MLELTLPIAADDFEAEPAKVAARIIETFIPAGAILERYETPSSSPFPILARAYVADAAKGRATVDALRQTLAASPESDHFGPLQLKRLDEADWTEAWKRRYHPRRVGRTLVISPTWEQPDAREGDRVIWLDPGMAFGTGMHPSTTLILQLLERHMRPGRRVLDVGTGSGILAIAACKLGASHVDATDIDPDAVRVAQENARTNKVSDRVRVWEGSVPDSGEYDLICANILAETLADLILHADLSERLTPNGVLLLSGIVAPREHVVHLALAARELQVRERVQEGDWVALAGLRL